jgi:hypothetical protein
LPTIYAALARRDEINDTHEFASAVRIYGGYAAPTAPRVRPVARWKAVPIAAAFASAKAGAITVTPNGSPSARKPFGTAMPDRSIKFTKLA